MCKNSYYFAYSLEFYENKRGEGIYSVPILLPFLF
jgi:hypothetical protein